MKQYSIEIKWAFIFFAVSLAWMILERLVGLHDTYIRLHPFISMFFMVPAIAVYVFAFLDKKKNFYQGNMNYLQGLIFGLIVSAIISALTPLTQFLNSYVITPHYFENAIRYAVDHQQMSQDDANAYFSFKNYMIQSCMAAPLIGTITSVVVAFFTKSKAA
jgi:hypothetical protein